MNGNKTVRKYEQAHPLKIVQDSMFIALQETLEVAYNNELEKKASRKCSGSIPKVL